MSEHLPFSKRTPGPVSAMEIDNPVESETRSAFEPQKENNSGSANGALPAGAPFLKESFDDDAKLLKGDGKAENPDSSAELMDELQVRW